MKTLAKILVFVALVMTFINADTTTGGSTPAATGTIAQVNSDHYRIFYEGAETDAKNFAVLMESGLELYNSVLHFDLAKLTIKLKVRIFASKSSFDAYLLSVVKETKDDFVYIHYSDLGKSELVGYQKAAPVEFITALLHQGAVQFLKAYVASPPLWLQEGLAAYFEQATLDAASNKYNLPSDLVWLTTLKKMAQGGAEQTLIAFDTFLSLDKTQAQVQLASFYPQAWGLIYFLLHSPNPNVNRILWDSIAALDPALDFIANSSRVKEKAFAWFGMDNLETAFKDYFTNLKTLSDLVAEGVTYYSNNDFDKSRDAFTQAQLRNANNYIPYYYLGLISYNKKDYAAAETFYLRAMDLKAPEALIDYAIGVNAYADNNYEKAASYLKNAKTKDPQNYTDKVDSILADIESEAGDSPSPAPTQTPVPSPSPSPK